jgi:hypothetical protein
MLDALWSDIYFGGFWQAHNYSPDDIAKMRQAFRATYAERHQSLQTEAQRLALAKAIFINYSPLHTELERVAAASRIMELPASGSAVNSDLPQKPINSWNL